MAHDDNWLGPKTGSRMVVAGAAAASDANSSPRRWPMACTSRCWTCPRPCAPTAALPAPDTSALTRLKSSPWSRRSHRSGAPGATSMRSCSFAAIRYCRAVLGRGRAAGMERPDVGESDIRAYPGTRTAAAAAGQRNALDNDRGIEPGLPGHAGHGCLRRVQGRPGQPDQGIRHGTGSHARANVVAPGAVETAFLGGGTGREDIVSDRGWFDQLSDKYVSSIPLGRVASPADIVGPILFLSGPGAGYITGRSCI